MLTINYSVRLGAAAQHALRRRVVRVVVFVFTIALLPLVQTDIAHGQSPATTPRFLSPDETLAGITRIVVFVDFANSSAVRQGLDAVEIRARIEQRLHDAGLTIEPSSLENAGDTTWNNLHLRVPEILIIPFPEILITFVPEILAVVS